LGRDSADWLAIAKRDEHCPVGMQKEGIFAAQPILQVHVQRADVGTVALVHVIDHVEERPQVATERYFANFNRHGPGLRSARSPLTSTPSVFLGGAPGIAPHAVLGPGPQDRRWGPDPALPGGAEAEPPSSDAPTRRCSPLRGCAPAVSPKSPARGAGS